MFQENNTKVSFSSRFNFIILNEVSQSVLLSVREQIHFVNIFSNLSAPVQCSTSTFLSSCWDSTWFTITSKNTVTLLNMLFIKLKN